MAGDIMDCRPLLIAVLMGATGLAAAQTYKWTDENGKVHFSDTPPAERKAEQIKVRPAVPGNSAAAAKQPGWQAQLEASRMRDLQAQRDKDAAERQAQADAANCLQARRQLDTLNSQVPVYRVDKDGARQYLDDKDRPARISAAQERVDRYCR